MLMSYVGRCSRRCFSTTSTPLQTIFLGAPGVGKGTFSRKIGPHFNIPILSTGDMIRAEIKAQSDIGNEVKKISEAGNLVPDSIVTALAKAQLEKAKSGWLLDGFPRTAGQAESLDTFAPPNLIVNLNLPEDLLVEKICARRVCSGCGENYNLADINRDGIVMSPLLPKVAGICDKCGSKLIQRADDTEEIVSNRLKVYNSETKPLIDYYGSKVLEFNIKKGVDDLPDLISAMEAAVSRA